MNESSATRRTGSSESEAAPAPSEAQVDAFLRQHPDFFERHPQLLSRLRLRHPRGEGATISLIERQVDVLREKLKDREERLATLIRVARENHEVGTRLHALTRRLLGTPSRERALVLAREALRKDFALPHSVLILSGEDPGLPADGDFPRRVAGDDPHLRAWQGLFDSGKPRCGLLPTEQLAWLFGDSASEIRSTALVPLVGAAGASPTGLLALGSSERSQFRPDFSTDFLERLGELLTATVLRHA